MRSQLRGQLKKHIAQNMLFVAANFSSLFAYGGSEPPFSPANKSILLLVAHCQNN